MRSNPGPCPNVRSQDRSDPWEEQEGVHYFGSTFLVRLEPRDRSKCYVYPNLVGGHDSVDVTGTRVPCIVRRILETFWVASSSLCLFRSYTYNFIP